jgi:hypothetical protein
VYGYKVIVRRPPADNTWGVANGARLFYWAAHDGWSVRIAIHNKMGIYQDRIKEQPRFIALYITMGLSPQKHRIRIAAIPYPMYSNKESFRNIIQFGRNRYVGWIKTLLMGTTPQGFAASVLASEVETVIVDSYVTAISNTYGETIEFDVPVITPKITTHYERSARKLLYQHNLVPVKDNRVVKTARRELDQRIATQSVPLNKLVRAGTRVTYRIYKWGGNKIIPHPYGNTKEKCGDGIDNNNNNQIDEGCYKKVLLVDDSQCRDDTIGVYIDGRNMGNTPAGHKRSYDLSRFKRGYHYLEIVAVRSDGKAKGCEDSDAVSWKATLGKGMKFYSGGRQKSGILHAKATDRKKKVAKYSIFIP